MSEQVASGEQATIDAQLQLLRTNLARGAYPEYPEQDDRFTAATLRRMGRTGLGGLVIPDGPWSVDAHSNRKAGDTEIVPSDTVQAELLAEGLRLDMRGRPLHPWLEPMLADPAIGVVGGKGAYWQWGPNKAVDSVVIADEHVLLIQRGDTGHWALPGGFRDGNEAELTAARREVKEETGLSLREEDLVTTVYDGPVVDTRVTAHAWPESTALLFKPRTRGPVRGMDDARDARWMPLSTVTEQDVLFGSHQFLLEQALRRA